MEISIKGLAFIKEFEGCDLVAVKNPGEKYFTIGYGHYGADVKPNQTITEAEAATLLNSDLKSYYPKIDCLNQAEFDSIVSYFYNCGTGAGLAWKNRNRHVYVGDTKLDGLVRRRKAEMIMSYTGLYLTDMTPCKTYLKSQTDLPYVYYGSGDMFYNMIVQFALNVEADGFIGDITRKAIKEFQTKKKLDADGIVGSLTWAEIKKLKF